jgi:hypothetical protein
MSEENIKTIDLDSNWKGLLPALIEVAANGTTLEGRNAAMAELKRMAKLADDVQGKYILDKDEYEKVKHLLT